MEEKKGKGLRFVLLTYAVRSCFYLLAGNLLVVVVSLHPLQSLTLDEPFGTLNIWSHFDGEHYIKIALEGYYRDPDYGVVSRSPAFFPLYPLLIRTMTYVFGGPVTLGTLSVWGVVISLLTFPLALYFVYRIAENGWGTRVAQGTVLTLAFFPTSFFFNAVYTESLFLALSGGAVWAARVRKDLFLACLLAGLAAATRNVGMFLLIPLTYEWLKGVRYYRWRGVYLLLAPSGLIAYMTYLWWRFGDPLIFYSEQGAKWGRQATNPLAMLGTAWDQASFNGFFLGFVIVLFIIGLRLLPLDLSAYTFMLAVLPAFFGPPPPDDPLLSFPRHLLVAFPLFIVLGVLLRKRWALAGWLVASAAASLVFCGMFVTWRFVA